MVRKYTTAVKTFNTWFEEAFVRTHASAFDQLKALEAAAAAAFRQAAGETTEPLRVPPNPLVKVREIA